MDFETLFGLFHTKYRGEESPPGTTDPEWKIAIRNYNSALDRLETYDDTRWDFMKTTLGSATQTVDRTLTTGDSSFTAPTDMLFPGGVWWTIDTSGNKSIARQVSRPEEIGLINSSVTTYGYFLGDQINGFTFYVNPTVGVAQNGFTLDYNYYKKFERLDPDFEDGTSLIAPASSEYFACFLAAQRFLDSRNFPAYQVMKRDSEESLKQMRLRNNSGDYFNVPTIQDTGPGFGV